MRTMPFAVGALVVGALLAGCKPKPTGPMPFTPIGPEYDRPLPPGQLALRKLADPAEIPDFTHACENTAALRLAIQNSLNYLAKPSSKAFFPYAQVTHDQAVASLKEFLSMLEGAPSPSQLNQLIRERFDVYISVGCDERGTVLFTGYYTPIFDASLVRTDKYRHPLYRPPPNLVKAGDGTTLGLRGPGGQVDRCPARAELERSGLLEGLELAWLGDPFEVYIAHVQGSAKLRLPDGQTLMVGYAANNGHEYKSIAMELIADGKLPKEKVSLGAMIEHFRKNPHEVRQYTGRNPRYVFFTPGGDAPRGSLNEPVTPWRTIATDKSVFPRGCLAFVSATLPRRTFDGVELLPYAGFALDQDTGGAIRAPGRCDVYMGVGDQAGEQAGRTYQEGRLYYLFLKPSAVPVPALSAVPGHSAPAPAGQ